MQQQAFTFILLSLLVSSYSQTINQWKGPMSTADIQIILNTHNLYRSQMALQSNTIGPKLPYARNMYQVYWSPEIAQKAQAWADRCIFQHSPSTYRTSSQFSYLGENLYTSSTSGSYFQPINWNSVITSWFKEISLLPPMQDVIYTNTNFPYGTGHFTQVIWAKSYQIGCGIAQYRNPSTGWNTNLYVCQYGYGGNYLNTRVYAPGPYPGCSCPTGTGCFNPNYNGLCCPIGYCSPSNLVYPGSRLP
jgi:hypothetical protein